MGYYTHVEGEITINPPLNQKGIAYFESLVSQLSKYGELDVKLRVTEETVETDEGTLIRRVADALVPYTDDSYKAYGIDEHVKGVVNAFGAKGHNFTGVLEGSGEDDDDLWRLHAFVRNVDGCPTQFVQKVKAEIHWPEPDVPEELK